MTSKVAFVLLSLIFLSVSLLALPDVSIEPQRPVEVLELYPGEVDQLLLRVKNNTQQLETNITVDVSADEHLIVSNGLHTITELRAGEEKTFLVKVQPVFSTDELQEELPGKLLVTANYGVDTFTHYVGTFIRPLKPVVQLVPELSETELRVGEETLLVLIIKNASDDVIATNLVWNFETTGDIDLNVQQDRLPALQPEESITRHYSLNPGPQSLKGKNVLQTTLFFTDQRGHHTLENQVSFDVRLKGPNYLFTAPIVVVLVLLIFVLRRRFGKKKPPIVPEEDESVEAPAEQ